MRLEKQDIANIASHILEPLTIINEVEGCDFACQAGTLENCAPWKQIKVLLKMESEARLLNFMNETDIENMVDVLDKIKTKKRRITIRFEENE